MILGVKASCALLTLLLAVACHRDEEAKGPFERAGAGLDRAADKTGHALSNAATTTGTAVQKAGQATGKAFVKVGDKLSGKGAGSPEARPATPSDEKARPVTPSDEKARPVTPSDEKSK